MSYYKDMQKTYLDYTSKASQSVKTNAISGLAAVWIISHPPKDSTSLFFEYRHLFAISALLFICAIGLDLIHSFSGSIVFWIYIQQKFREYKGHEKERDKTNFTYPWWVTWIPWTFYVLKILAIVAATLKLISAVLATR